MATFRDSGLELNVKADISEFSTPTGDRFTIFAVNSTSPSGRYYKAETGQQLWMVDSSGGMHEVSNEWLETKVAETSAKLDYIYPAVTQFMSAGLLFLNSSTTQTISSDLNIIGTTNVSGATNYVQGSLTIESDCPVTINAPVSAYADMKVYAELDVNTLGTPDTLSKITPFFVRSSTNRLQPAGWSDPALLVIGNTRIYDMFKPTDRGLRFTVMHRETFQILHDEVYDTAGSQHRVTDLAWKMFTLMNNTKHVGILNSREDWESLIWRKDTVEAAGMSASDISAAYSNLTVGTLLDQFERFGLLKAIRAAGKHAEMYPDVAASQYCAIFEGSNIYVDTSGASAVVYPTNRAVESWVPRVSALLPVAGEQMHAQLAGWFIQPRQLDITNNIADRSATFVAFPYGRESDAVRETVYVNKDGGPAEFNARVSNVEADVLKTTFSSPSGLWHLVGDVRIEADIVNVTGSATTVTSNTLDITSTATTLIGTSLDITAATRHVGQIDMTDHKIVNLAYADIDSPQDAVNVEFTRVVTPIGAALDFGGTVAPSNFLMCQGAAALITSFDKLYNVISLNFGFGTSVTLSGNPYVLTSSPLDIISISGVPMYQTKPIYDIGGAAHTFTGVISGSNPYSFVTGTVNMVSGNPTFVADGAMVSLIDHFLLPNTSGRSSVGAGTTTVLDISGNTVIYTYNVGGMGGADKHKLSVEEMPNHAHTFNTLQDDFAFISNTQPPPAFMRDGANVHVWTTSAVGGDKFHNNMQPYTVFNKIIRYK
jgi:microcystin-dependent protein